MDFYSIIAVVVLVVIAAYFIWSRFVKAKPVVEESSLAPYKVEAPEAPVAVAPVAEVKPEVKPQQPELKVVAGNAAVKPARQRKPRVKKTAQPAVKPAVKPAAQPKAAPVARTRKPRQTTPKAPK